MSQTVAPQQAGEPPVRAVLALGGGTAIVAGLVGALPEHEVVAWPAALVVTCAAAAVSAAGRTSRVELRFAGVRGVAVRSAAVRVAAALLLPVPALVVFALVVTALDLGVGRGPRRLAWACTAGLLSMLASCAVWRLLLQLSGGEPAPAASLTAVAAGAAALVQLAVATALFAVMHRLVTGQRLRVRGDRVVLLHGDVAEVLLGALVVVLLQHAPALALLAVAAAMAGSQSVALREARLAGDTDSKTGLLNMERFRHLAERALRARERPGELRPVLLMIDLDRMREVNNEHGHLVGDLAIQRVADVLVAGLRGDDLVARFGGEEYAVLVPAVLPAEAVRTAERLRSSLAEQPIALPDGRELRVTVSIGVAPRRPGEPLEDLMRRADAALYDAKRLGRDRVCVSEGSEPTGAALPAGTAQP